MSHEGRWHEPVLCTGRDIYRNWLHRLVRCLWNPGSENVTPRHKIKLALRVTLRHKCGMKSKKLTATNYEITAHGKSFLVARREGIWFVYQLTQVGGIKVGCERLKREALRMIEDNAYETIAGAV
jgi:hypothetical protein